ncbi:MAG TPA: hypothetical protein EYP59_00830 [Thiotrichaceae bacterium]|nr:hypothetical protein [Thiotrichaceae bacterium]
MRKSLQFYLMGLLLFLISGCQQTLLVKGGPGAECTTPPHPPTNRHCFSSASRPDQRAQNTVFMLAMGANTGKLTKTSSDLENFSQTMQKHFKMPQSQVCQLPNVFKSELEVALQSLNEHLAADDLVIIYFSGHGTFIKDNDGDEKDGWDEILVTYDSHCKTPVKDEDGLRDDYFVKLVNELRTDRVLTVMDSCFASGMFLGQSRSNPLLANARPKFLQIGWWGSQEPRLEADDKRLIKNEVGNLDALKGLLLAAADEKQYALEMPEKGGLFTFMFVEQLSQYADFKKAFVQTARKIQDMTRQSQSPQAIGRWEILEE